MYWQPCFQQFYLVKKSLIPDHLEIQSLVFLEYSNLCGMHLERCLVLCSKSFLSTFCLGTSPPQRSLFLDSPRDRMAYTPLMVNQSLYFGAYYHNPKYGLYMAMFGLALFAAVQANFSLMLPGLIHLCGMSFPSPL